MNLWNEGIESLKGIHCRAEYKEQVIPENRGNPFIEALPDRLSMDEFFDELYSAPQLEDGYSKLGVEDRIALVRQIKPSFWLPIPNHYNKYRGIYNMLKIGYQSRNPQTAMYNRQFAIGLDKILEGGLDENGANKAGNIQTAQSLAEIGISGVGKSKAYERILKLLFPQVIHHSEYHGKPLLMTQVVWMHIECPSGKSVGALCKNFYDKVDQLLGSNFYQKYGEKSGNIDVQAKRMVIVAAQINLGVLVIDEIQRVNKAHSGGDQRMIEFITELVNTIGIPVIMIGTFKAMYLFDESVANSRRGTPDEYHEEVIIDRLSENSWEWNELVESLWDLQYSSNFTPLSDELKRVFYYHTLGIPDILVKLFMHVQSKAILKGGEEQITISLINEVASKSLKLLQPVFEKLRRGDTSALSEWDDIKPEWSSFNDYLNEAAHRVNVHGKLAEDHARSLRKMDKESILEDLVKFALNLVGTPELAEVLANQVYEASGGMGDKQKMFAQLAQLALEANGQVVASKKENNSLPKQKKTKKTKPILEENDIRFIVQQGHTKGLSTEEALEEANLINDCDDLLKFCN